MAIIGIDLGTTNSLGCLYRDGKTVLIPNSEGSFLTPSAVSVLPDGTVIVGEKAKERKISHPDETILSMKRLMGSKNKIQLGPHSFLPEELSSFVIASIIKDAEKFLGEKITEAVISVPAYFHDVQRAATKRAGALAGVTVNRILNEPSAAALAAYQNQTQEKKFMVFDFGGGTLDVSLVSCIGNIVEIQGVSGDNHLGGDDFDRLMADAFLKEMNLNKEDISKQEYEVLVKKASLCKEELTISESAKIEIMFDGKLYETVYSEKRLMQEANDILMKIRSVIGQALSDSDVKASQIHQIIMVGGSSKMPLIQKFIRHLFHRIPDVSTNCDEMVAIGLGYFCGIMEKSEGANDYLLTDVCPFSLGTSINNPLDSTKLFMSKIIHKNSKLPCSVTHHFSNAADMQTKIKFDILQGEELYAKDNLNLGQMDVDITPKLAGKETINACFTYDINGILIVDIEVPSNGKKYSKVLSEDVSEAELKERIKKLRDMTVDPASLPKNQQLIEELEKIYVQANPKQQLIINGLVNEFAEALASKSPSEIAKMQNKIEEQLPKLAYWDPLNDVFLKDAEEDWDDPWAEKKEESTPFSLDELFWEDGDTGHGGFFS